MGGCRGHDRGCMSVGAMLLIVSYIETPPAVSTCPSNLHLREYTSLFLTNEYLALTNESHTLTHSHVETTYLRPSLPTPNTSPLSYIFHLPHQLSVYYTIPYTQAILYIYTHLIISMYDTPTWSTVCWPASAPTLSINAMPASRWRALPKTDHSATRQSVFRPAS